eukprot:Gb_25115 [translate_table: standard]
MERLQRGMLEPFPSVNNTAAPDPSPFFADSLRNSPLPTNSAWQNFVLRDGSQPEYIHPYLVQSKQGSLTICYPARAVQPRFIFQAFVANITISCAPGSHVVSHFDGLSVTLDLPGPLIVPLVRGSPYITCIVQGGDLKISTIHAVLDVSSNDHCTKHKIVFNNGQIWLIYSSNSLHLNKDLSISDSFEGILRLSILTGKDEGFVDAREEILDRFSTAYPVSGRVDLRTPFMLKYEWKKKGWGELLMLSHPVHRQILASPATDMIISDLSYRSIDGELVGVVGDSWILDETPITVDWYSMNGMKNQNARDHVITALEDDVSNLQPITTSSTYFYGKAIARAARLALIAEETHHQNVIPIVQEFLEKSITPWLDGSFQGNAFLYDKKWGGLISRDGARDSGADFGLGVYNDHHYHFGYFCYAAAVLAKINHSWARKFKPQIYSIVNDYMTTNPSQQYPRLRNFDLWKLHSWASGITEFADGRNQESTSEALNAYYSAALLGLAYGDTHLISTGSTLAALEMRSAKALWLVPLNSTVYESEFVEENRVVGVLWANKRDSGLWFAPAEWRECRLGIQLLPILPITDLLYSNLEFVKELVQWTYPALNRDGVGEGWKGFVYALEGMYDRESALNKVMALNGFDDGNSLTNLLWWIYTRANDDSQE